MRLFPRFRQPVGEASSDTINQLSSPAAKSGRVITKDGYVDYYPDPPFRDRFEAYDTIGRIFSAVESVVKAVNKRDFYFANTDEEDEDETKIKRLENWELAHNGSRFVEELVRGLLKAGTVIIGPDYEFVPMTSVKYMRRDVYGKIRQIILDVNGKEWPLGYVEERGVLVEKIPIDHYTIAHYIHDNRDPWGKNLYYPICSTFNDMDGKESTPLYKGFRQMEQDGIRMHHKLAAPKSVWIFPKLLNNKELNVNNPNSLAYRIGHMRPGDSVVGGKDFEGASKLTDQIDGKTRFPEVTDLIKGEVEVASQSSAARLIEDPSAMADAREANNKDSDTVLYVCELIRRLFDYVIIPREIGDMSVEFKWGSSDDFHFDFNETLQAVQGGIISIEEAREQMKAAGRRLDDNMFRDKPGPQPQSPALPFMNQPQADQEINQLKKEAYRKYIKKLDSS